MNAATRRKIIEKLHAEELGMIASKGREYTGGAEEGNEQDTLFNFKDVATQTGVDPLQTWATYFLKHVSSIMTYIKDPSREADMSEPIDGRITDARTYLGLLQCLIDERRALAITDGWSGKGRMPADVAAAYKVLGKAVKRATKSTKSTKFTAHGAKLESAQKPSKRPRAAKTSAATSKAPKTRQNGSGGRQRAGKVTKTAVKTSVPA